MSGCHMVFESGLKSENQTKNVCVMVNHVHFLNGPPNNHLKTEQKKCSKSQMFRFQVFGIQMVTVITMFEQHTKQI